MNPLTLLTSQVDTTGDGFVRVGAATIERDLAIAFAVRLLDAAGASLRELPPALARDADSARRVLAYLDEVFSRSVEVQCKVDKEARRLPAVRFDGRRGLVRAGALVTGHVVRRGVDRSWSGLLAVWRWDPIYGCVAEPEPGYRRCLARYAQIEAAPVAAIGAARVLR